MNTKRILLVLVTILILLCSFAAAQKVAFEDSKEVNEKPSSYQSTYSGTSYGISGSDTNCFGKYCTTYQKVCSKLGVEDTSALTFINLDLNPYKLYVWDSEVTVGQVWDVISSSNKTIQNASKDFTQETLTFGLLNVTRAGWRELPGFAKATYPKKSSLIYSATQCKEYKAVFENVFSPTPYKYDIEQGSDRLDPLIYSNQVFAGNTTYPFTDDMNSTVSTATIAAASISFPGGGGGAYVIDEFNYSDGDIVTVSGGLWEQVSTRTIADIESERVDMDINDNAQIKLWNFSADPNGTNRSFYLQWTMQYDHDVAGDNIDFCAYTSKDVRCIDSSDGPGFGFEVLGGGTLSFRVDNGDVNTSGAYPWAVGVNYTVKWCWNVTDTCDNHLKVKIWDNRTAEPTAWNHSYRPTAAQVNDVMGGDIGAGDPGVYFGFVSQDSGGGNIVKWDNLLNLNNQSSLDTTQDYARSKQFATTDAIRAFNLSYAGVFGALAPVLNASCDGGVTWNRTVSNTSSVNCTTAGTAFMWDVELKGVDSSYSFANASWDLQFNEAPLINKASLQSNTSERAFNGSSQVVVDMEASDFEGDTVTVNVEWFVNHINVVNQTKTVKTSTNFTLGPGNFTGGDIINYTANVSDTFVFYSRVLNGSNISLAPRFVPPINISPSNETNFTDPQNQGSGEINVSWNASSDPDDAGTNVTYNVSFSEDGGLTFTTLTITNETNVSLNISNKAFKKTYQIKVRAMYGFNGSSAEVFSGNFTIGNGSLTHSTGRITPVYGFGQNVTTSHLIRTGFGTNISSGINIYHSNGSRFQHLNGTANGSTDSFGNTSNKLLGKNLTVEFIAENDAPNSSAIANISFSFNDYVFVRPTGNWHIALEAGKVHRTNITLTQNTPATDNNFTVRVINATNFTVNANWTSLMLKGADNYTKPAIIELNITANTNTSSDQWFIEINRTLDQKSFRIHPIITVVSNPGNLTLQINQTVCDFTNENCSVNEVNLSNGTFFDRVWTLNNTGGSQLASCRAFFMNTTEEITFADSNLTLSNASIGVGQSQTLTFATERNISLGNYNATVEVECDVGSSNTSLSQKTEQVIYLNYKVANSGSVPASSSSGGDTSGGGSGSGGGGLSEGEGIIRAVVDMMSVSAGDGECESGESLFTDFAACFTLDRARIPTDDFIRLAGILAAALLVAMIINSVVQEDEREKL